ncbi:hypothetical protein LCGC14_3026970, partial [marine sediment metagenome]
VKKLPGHVRQAFPKWEARQEGDPDYRVLMAGAKAGSLFSGNVIPDVRVDRGAEEALRELGLTEKEPMDGESSRVEEGFGSPGRD